MTQEQIIDKKFADFKAELLKELSPKTEFEVGKYYMIYGTGSYLVRFEKIKSLNGKESDRRVFGSLLNDSPAELGIIHLDQIKSHRPATESEVKEALEKEAIKRGFKADCTFRQPWNNDTTKVATSYLYEFEYKNGDCLYFRGDVIFQNGVWATIVKEEAIKIGSHEAKKVDNHFEIGCKKIHRSRVESLRDLMKHSEFKTVSFDSVSVNYETIEKLLKL